MARRVAGGIVSDNSKWYWHGIGWKPFDPATPKGEKPGREETRAARGMLDVETIEASKRLPKLVAEHGGLEALEATEVAVPGASGVSGVRPEQVTRTYTSASEFEKDAQAMASQGYRVASQSALKGHVNARRSVVRILTGGVLLGGVSRSKDQITVVYEK